MTIDNNSNDGSMSEAYFYKADFVTKTFANSEYEKMFGQLHNSRVKEIQREIEIVQTETKFVINQVMLNREAPTRDNGRVANILVRNIEKRKNASAASGGVSAVARGTTGLDLSIDDEAYDDDEDEVAPDSHEKKVLLSMDQQQQHHSKNKRKKRVYKCLKLLEMIQHYWEFN